MKPRTFLAMALAAIASMAAAGAAARTSVGAPLEVSDSEPHALPVGPGQVVVHPKFGGELLGFGIDASGTEGLLSEYKDLTDGTVFIATETFDQKTGKILKVVAKENHTWDNYSTWGVFGHHIGLDEFYQQSKQTFLTLNPLDANAFTGTWTPPTLPGYVFWGITDDNSTSSEAVVMTIENGGNLGLSIFSSNIAANTFGPQVAITDNEFCSCLSPVMALDTKTHQAVLASSNGGPSELALANLKTGKVTEFKGVGWNYVLGIAVDPATGIAVTTTQGDALTQAGVQFYDLAKQTGFQVILPCSNNGGEGESGAYVAFDPVNTLFLVEQPYNTCNNGSNIYVYDEKGNLIETLSNFQTLPVSPTPIALHPRNRSGFVFGNRFGTALQSFTY